MSLKTANAFKKLRGFEEVVRPGGVKTWEKVTNNKLNGLTRHLILPSGTNVVYNENYGCVTKKILKPDGTFFRSLFNKAFENKEGGKKLLCMSKINLKDYNVQKFSKPSERKGPVATEHYQIRNNVLGNLSLFGYIFK